MSAFEEVTQVVSTVASVDLSGNRFVKLDADSELVAAALSDAAYGVLTNDVKAGVAGRVAIGGIVPILVGGAGVVAGVAVGAGAGGVADPAATKKIAIPLDTAPAGAIVSFKLALLAA